MAYKEQDKNLESVRISVTNKRDMFNDEKSRIDKMTKKELARYIKAGHYNDAEITPAANIQIPVTAEQYAQFVLFCENRGMKQGDKVAPFIRHHILNEANKIVEAIK